MPIPKTPLVSADIIIELHDSLTPRIVLIERLNPPFGWALPGGFVDIGESVEMAAIREAKEETGLDVELQCLLGCYSEPSRDPRFHTVSLIYVATAKGLPVAGDDAKTVKLVEPEAIDLNLAFDHRRILDDYLAYKRSAKVKPLK